MCNSVACHSLASHNKLPLTLAHVLQVNVITLKADLKKLMCNLDPIDYKTSLTDYSNKLLHFTLFSKRMISLSKSLTISTGVKRISSFS